MREILFRGKLIGDDSWSYGNLVTKHNIIGKPKSGARIFTARVTPNGIIIDNILYGIRDLIDGHCNEKVKIRIVDNIATVFDIETGKQIIWFELFLHEGINCKHSFIPYTNEEIAKAIIFTQVVSRYGLQIDGKKYYLPDLVFSHLGYRVKIKIQGHMVDVYDFHNDKHLENFEL